MTDYRLPPGMTAKNLRFIADDLRSHNFVVFASTLGSWADAIDPPPSIVTGEMIGDVVAQVRQDGYRPDPDDAEVYLEAAVKCGWTPPRDLESDADNPSSSDDERLEMAERLLRLATLGVKGRDYGGGYWLTRTSEAILSAAEADYLRSLYGEGDSDE